MNSNNGIKFQIKPILIFVFVLLLASTVDVIADNQNFKKVKFKHINVEDGLTHHETLFVFQDTQGFLWFGTKHGLNKYDGMNVTPYFHDPNPENKNSLVGNFAHWIQEDKNSALWISTWGDGISKYDPKLDRFTNYRHDATNSQSLASNNVWSLFVDSKGLIWSATDNGVSKLNPETKTFVNYSHDPKDPESLSNNMVSRIREDAHGIFWISTYGGGLNRFNPKTEKFKAYRHIADDPQSISNNNLWGVYIDSSQRIWIASEKGLNRFEPETETFLSYQHDETDPRSLSSNTVTFIDEDHYGKLWLGTFGGGLNRFDPEQETFDHFRHNSKDPYSLSDDIIMSICEDNAGAIWVATYGGIDKYDPGEYQFEYYHGDIVGSQTSTTTKVRSIFQDKNGLVWIGTGGDGLGQFNRERKWVFNFRYDEDDPASISDNDIWAITQDKRGYLWIATHGGGLNRFDPVRKTFIRYQNDPKNSNSPSCDTLYDLAMDGKRDVLWIAAYLTGLDKLDLKTGAFTHYKYDLNNPDGIVSNWTTVVFVDSKGLVWIGTEAGLSLFNPETEQFTSFKHSNTNTRSLSANMVQSIYEDSKNTVWIGTSGGLNSYDETTQSFERYFQKDGLAGNHIGGITEDDNGYLWVSSDNGLSKFDSQKKIFRNYNKQDGLQGDRFLMHSVCKNNKGELFFGGTNGFNVFSPDKLEDNKYIPKIVFTDFQIFNQSIPVGKNSVLKKHINQTQEIVLDHDQKAFSIEFIALNFRNSANNRYAHKMEGFDKAYIYTIGNQRSATYTNLDSGQYLFRVMGSNNDNVWNEDGASIKIIIKPPWWGTIWFKVLSVLFIFSVLFSIFRYIQKLQFEINERKKAELALKKSQERFEMAMDAAQDGLYDWNLVTNEIYYSPAWKRMLGYEENELPNDFSVWEKSTDPEDVKRSWKMQQELINKKRDRFELEFKMKHKDGHWVDILSRAKALFNEHDDAARIVGTHVDITERKRQEEIYKQTIESSIDGFWITDLKGKFLEVNEAYSNMIGYSRDELLKMSISDVEAVEDKEEIQKRVEKIIQNGNDRFESKHCHKKGHIIFVEVSTTYTQNNGGMFFVFVRDITDRSQMEERLRQAQKMESIGNLAGGIAHDFNNILSSIIGFTELALDEASKGTLLEDSLQEVYSAGKRAKDLVKQILAFARQSDEKISPIQPRVIVEEVLNFIRSTIPTTIEIRENIKSESLILGNSTQVHQVLMNLCTNAAYAMEDSGGTLKLSLKDIFIDKEKVSIGMKPGDYIEVVVSDTGTGIAPEIIDSIFEPYFTTKADGEGTGIGLAMVQGVVESYGGKITVDSQLGKGTTFKIYLPITKKRSDHDAYVPEQLPTGTERILFVDDEAPIVKMGAQILERLGYSVTTRTSSVEALELFKTKPNDFDLVVTDMTMPNMTGEKLAVELMKIRPDMPVILCTGYSKKISDETASEIGIKAFAYKPVVKADLAKTVRKVLDAGRSEA